MRGVSAALPLLSKIKYLKFCFGGCFVDGTPVQMADGTTKPIEQIKQGDLILSKDEQTGIIAPKRVTGTSTRTIPVVETVNLADTSGKIVESLTVTGDHPFYVEGQGFLAAFELPVGIKVETKAGALTVASTERHETARGFVVHNFTVEDDHSYFVGTASGGAWVHNGYCDTFFAAHPNLNRAEWVVHHAIPQQIFEKYPSLFSASEKHALANLRGVSRAINNEVHLSYIAKDWNAFLAANPNPTRQQIEWFRDFMDVVWASHFVK